MRVIRVMYIVQIKLFRGITITVELVHFLVKCIVSFIVWELRILLLGKCAILKREIVSGPIRL